MNYTTLKGTVVKGRQKARDTGYPTANILCLDLKEVAIGGWAVIIKREYSKHYGYGIATPQSIFECHIEGLTEDIYGEILEISFIKPLEMSGDLAADMKKYLNRKCSNCQYCTLRQYGYSAWTIIGTESICAFDLRPDFDDESYNKTPDDLFAVNCPKYRKGNPIFEGMEE